MVAGGPADVSVRAIAALLAVTVKLCASFDPGCTVPEKFSVTTGRVGAVTDARVDAVVAGSEPVEQPVAASAPALRRASRYRFTSLLDNFYVTKRWLSRDKSYARSPWTAAISSSLTVWPMRG